MSDSADRPPSLAEDLSRASYQALLAEEDKRFLAAVNRPIPVAPADAAELRERQRYAVRLNAEAADLVVQRVQVEAALQAKATELIAFRQTLAHRVREIARAHGIDPDNTEHPYRLEITDTEAGFRPA